MNTFNNCFLFVANYPVDLFTLSDGIASISKHMQSDRLGLHLSNRILDRITSLLAIASLKEVVGAVKTIPSPINQPTALCRLIILINRIAFPLVLLNIGVNGMVQFVKPNGFAHWLCVGIDGATSRAGIGSRLVGIVQVHALAQSCASLIQLRALKGKKACALTRAVFANAAKATHFNGLGSGKSFHRRLGTLLTIYSTSTTNRDPAIEGLMRLHRLQLRKQTLSLLATIAAIAAMLTSHAALGGALWIANTALDLAASRYTATEPQAAKTTTA